MPIRNRITSLMGSQEPRKRQRLCQRNRTSLPDGDDRRSG
ncbi:hypothetical protein NPIL_264591, partial [Nephila pilipes]